MMNSSKRRRSKKAAAAGAVLLAVMLTASACGGNDTTNTGNEQQGSVNNGPVVDLPDESGVIEPDVSSPEPTADTDNNNGAENPPVDPVKMDEGNYTGLIDSHSIEIVTASGALALQITEELAATVENIPPNAKVKFEYTEKAIEGEADFKQNWLVKIEEIK
ncbi:hypothetical protein L1N85_20410 [Paenibacillus alkaliterrae]|uniref:hypothetical protein n=1 Tax=Paenibacillus alkaliterrae TaxID=320909 RepID=UPI001F31CE5B|nr:hypothetical protein [Paenibacillus alkaliterrae]MCF2940758.1 hypothetical protein [Paenibacillus alkaliterrae]